MWNFLKFAVAQIMAFVVLLCAYGAYMSKIPAESGMLSVVAAGCVCISLAIGFGGGVTKEKFHTFFGVFIAMNVVFRETPPTDFIGVFMSAVSVVYLLFSLGYAVRTKYKVVPRN